MTRLIDRALVKSSLLPGHVGSVQEAKAEISELYRLFHKNQTFKGISDAFLAWVLTDPSTGALGCFDDFAQVDPLLSGPWRDLVNRVAVSTAEGRTEPWLDIAEECKAAAEKAFELSGNRGEVDFKSSCTRAVWSALGAAASVCKTNALFYDDPFEVAAWAKMSADQGMWAIISRKKAEAYALNKSYEAVQRVENLTRGKVGVRPRLKLFHMVLDKCDPEFEWAVRSIRGEIHRELRRTDVDWHGALV